LKEYEKHKLINIAKADFKFPEDDIEKRKLKKLKKMYEPLTNFLKEQLKDFIEKVYVTQKLVTDPVMVIAREGGQSA
jgi:HSP90 family molecular chaperone